MVAPVPKIPLRPPASNLGSEMRAGLDGTYRTELFELDEDERLSQVRVKGSVADITPGRDRVLLAGGVFVGDEAGTGYSAGKGPEILGLEECVRRLCMVVTVETCQKYGTSKETRVVAR